MLPLVYVYRLVKRVMESQACKRLWLSVGNLLKLPEGTLSPKLCVYYHKLLKLKAFLWNLYHLPSGRTMMSLGLILLVADFEDPSIKTLWLGKVILLCHRSVNCLICYVHRRRLSDMYRAFPILIISIIHIVYQNKKVKS